MPMPIPPTIKIMMASEIGTLAGGQFGLLGGQGLGPPLPPPGCVKPVNEVTSKTNVNNTVKSFILIISNNT